MESFWNFLSVVIIALLTQRVIAWREGKKKIKDEQLNIYITTVKPLSDFYMLALEKPSDELGKNQLYRKYIEIMATLSIIGTDDVMEAFHNFSEYVFELLKISGIPDEVKLRKLLSQVTYKMCCDIHGEKRRK